MEELLKASEGLLIVGLIVSVIQIILIGALAQKKNRSIVGWCIASLFFGLIPFIIQDIHDFKNCGISNITTHWKIALK